MHRNLIFLGFSYSLGFPVAAGLSGECVDLHGRTIAPGLHYVPGPDTCTLCVCDNGNPKWCKAVLCSPPQCTVCLCKEFSVVRYYPGHLGRYLAVGALFICLHCSACHHRGGEDCKSFRVGNSCCEFICLDDTLPKTSSDGNGPDSGTDLGLRLIASAVTAILSLSLLFFLIHRLRQRKIRGRQNRQLSEDERSLASIGYIAGSLAYLPGSMGYLGAGTQDRHLEFHYEEPPSEYPLWKPPGNYFPRGEAPPPYEEAVAAARAEAALAAAVASSTSAPASTTSGLIASGAGHRTIPINLATSGSFRIDASAVVGQEPSRSRSAEIVVEAIPPPIIESRQSSHVIDIPAPLPMTAEEEGAVAAIRSDAFYEDVIIGPPPSLASPVECFNSSITSGKSKSSTTASIPSQEGPACASDANISLHPGSPSDCASSVSKDNDAAKLNSPRLNDLNKHSLDSGTCSCSYQCLPSALPPDDNDDYRSECENCKSTQGSRYYLDQEPSITSPQETMTLHRRPQDYDAEDQGYYRTSLTLPIHTRRLRSVPMHSTAVSSLHGARENWFSSMPASSTSSTSSEEE